MSSADAVSASQVQLPSQVSPPDFALSAAPPHGVVGVEVVALPVLPGEDGSAPLLGPGGADLADLLGIDLFGVLEVASATGRAGEVTSVPVPLGQSGQRRPHQRPADRGRRPARAGLPSRRCRGGAGDPRPWRRGDHDPGDRARRGDHAVRRGHDARLVRLPLALGPAGAPSGRAGGARGPARRPRAGPRARGRRRRCRMARADARHGAGQPQEPGLARRAGARARRRARPRLPGLGRAAARRRGLRRHRRGRPGLRHAAAADPPRLRAAQGRPSYADGRARRQGDHLRHRRPVDQARRGDGQHEARHDRRRHRARDHGGARRGRLPGPRGRAGPGRRERDRRQRAAPRRRAPALGRPHLGGHQHRRRGPAGAGRRAGVRRGRDQARRRGRRRHPHRRDEGRAGPAGGRLLRQRRRCSPA